MLPFAPLALVPLLVSSPEWPSMSFEQAELGGAVATRDGRPLPSVVPVTVDLYSGDHCLGAAADRSGCALDRLVASAPVDLSGRFVLVSPPGDYWLQLNVGGHEARVERVLLRAGSWLHDLEVPDAAAAAPPAALALSQRKEARHVVGVQ